MKTIILTLLFTGCVSFGFAQYFSQGAGLTTVIESGDGLAGSASLGIVYSPKIIFPFSKTGSVSLGIPMSIGGININTNLKSGFGSGYDKGFFYADVPLMADFNVGAGATRLCKYGAGFFIGGGLDYHRRTSGQEDKSAYDKRNVSGFAPVIDIGARFATGHHKHNVELKTSLQKVNFIAYSHILSSAAIYNF